MTAATARPWQDPHALAVAAIEYAGLLATLGLSPREVEVIQGCADGLTNAQIGARLHLTTNTVKSHVQNIGAKLGARGRANVVAIAIRNGVIS